MRALMSNLIKRLAKRHRTPPGAAAQNLTDILQRVRYARSIIFLAEEQRFVKGDQRIGIVARFDLNGAQSFQGMSQCLCIADCSTHWKMLDQTRQRCSAVWLRH